MYKTHIWTTYTRVCLRPPLPPPRPSADLGVEGQVCLVFVGNAYIMPMQAGPPRSVACRAIVGQIWSHPPLILDSSQSPLYRSLLNYCTLELGNF
jgi:hypothetical protein